MEEAGRRVMLGRCGGLWSRFGQPNRDGSEVEPEPGVCKRKAARKKQDRGSPGDGSRQQSQGTVLNRGSGGLV